MTTRPITIMIIDDHVVIRSGLRMLIEHDQRMKVVAQAGSRTEALERAASTNPDVIILDLLLGDEDGLSFLPELCQASPSSRVLVLTGVQNPDAHRRAIRRALARRTPLARMDYDATCSGASPNRRLRLRKSARASARCATRATAPVCESSWS